MIKIRLYFQQEIVNLQPLFPSKRQIHYLKNVLRLRNNENINIFNGREEWDARVRIDKNKMYLVPTSLNRTDEKDQDIWICFSLIKSRNINFLLEKVLYHFKYPTMEKQKSEENHTLCMEVGI